MDSLYKEFTLTSADVAKSMFAFIKQNAGAFAERGTPLSVVITEDEPDRLDYQLRYYFGPLLSQISANAWVQGRKYHKDIWHVQFAQMFLPSSELVLPNGSIEIVRGSIARGKIGVRKMAEYTLQVEAYATQELGVELKDNRQ